MVKAGSARIGELHACEVPTNSSHECMHVKRLESLQQGHRFEEHLLVQKAITLFRCIGCDSQLSDGVGKGYEHLAEALGHLWSDSNTVQPYVAKVLQWVVAAISIPSMWLGF